MTDKDQDRGLVYQSHPSVVSWGTPCDSGARYQREAEPGGHALKSVMQNLRDVQDGYPPLTAEQERALVEEHAGDRAKLEELLVLHNMRFAWDYVRMYRERTEDPEDMWMRGMHGLAMAAKAYDPSRGKRFCTIAGYYIHRAMRDLFDPMLSGPKTQAATRAVYDQPKSGGENEDASTIGEWFQLSGCAPDWTPPSPDKETRARADEQDAQELAEYLANRFGKSKRERNILRARLGGWTYERIGEQLMGGVPRDYARRHVEKLMQKIAKAVNGKFEDDELRSVFARHGKPLPQCIGPDTLNAFLSENNVALVDNADLEGFDVRLSRMTEEYLAAEAEHKTVIGRRDGGDDYDRMRVVYAEVVIGGGKLSESALRHGVSVSQAEKIRDDAVKMVQDHRHGRLRRLYEKRLKPVDAASHMMKDELFNVVDYGFGRTDGGIASNYDLFMGGATRAKSLGRGLVTTWKYWRSGFYSHANYLKMKHRGVLGKYRITKREAQAIAQFCDDVPAWIAVKAGGSL